MMLAMLFSISMDIALKENLADCYRQNLAGQAQPSYCRYKCRACHCGQFSQPHRLLNTLNQNETPLSYCCVLCLPTESNPIHHQLTAASSAGVTTTAPDGLHANASVEGSWTSCHGAATAGSCCQPSLVSVLCPHSFTICTLAAFQGSW